MSSQTNKNVLATNILTTQDSFMEKEIGKVVHYFDKAMAAVIRLTGNLKVGDTIKFVHGDSEFTQTVDSLEVDREKIKSGKAGEEVAVKVNEKTHEHAKVFKLE